MIFVGRRSDVRTISETTGITPLLSPNPDQNCVKCLKSSLEIFRFLKKIFRLHTTIIDAFEPKTEVYIQYYFNVDII